MFFKDRKQAGSALAEKLSSYKDKTDVLIFAIPRGGVPVASEVAKKLDVPLNLVVVKKVGAPTQEELAIGAVGPGDFVVLDKALISKLKVGEKLLQEQIAMAKGKVSSYLSIFKVKEVDIGNKEVILVDDGIATGATVRVAVEYLKSKNPQKITLAVPVAANDSTSKLKNIVDEIVVIHKPEHFQAVGQFYQDFPQVADKEVVRLLQ